MTGELVDGIAASFLLRFAAVYIVLRALATVYDSGPSHRIREALHFWFWGYHKR